MTHNTPVGEPCDYSPIKVPLFTSHVLLKRRDCNRGSKPGPPFPPAVALFVKTTNVCNARCPFCCNDDCRGDNAPFDTDRFFAVVDTIMNHDTLRLGSIRFTGGEPSVVKDKLMLPLLKCLSHAPYDRLFLHLNTNALRPEARELMHHPRWNSISVSMHHYDRTRLAGIYNTDLGQPLHLEQFRRNGLMLNVNCNLIRGYIDSAAEARRMMDYVLECGAQKLGFVSLMKVNDYCRSHYIDYDEIDWQSIPSLYFQRSLNRGADCKCCNYMYNNNGRMLLMYMRNNLDPNFFESSLLFDGQHLRQGFYDASIIY